ncbi:MAG: phosphatidylserine/phosphatidylglycerophosphate/cardiolipin synthase family protein [Gemmatimonadetes bacterium]|nr:phosphatidylserine/phosphatidylglycerophosphate/cardiolipin synthase family protein [Gemmatimonadota bacterium]
MSKAASGALGVRHIHSRFGGAPIQELLQTIFAAELVLPSRCIWLVSPWISDIPVVDNRANGFLSLASGFERTRLSLSTILTMLLQRGTSVHVVTKPEEASKDFVERLLQRAGGSARRLRVRMDAPLHEKGLLGDGYYLSGSMNFTFNGIGFNQEAVHYFTRPEDVAENRHHFMASYGGVLI